MSCLKLLFLHSASSGTADFGFIYRFSFRIFITVLIILAFFYFILLLLINSVQLFPPFILLLACFFGPAHYHSHPLAYGKCRLSVPYLKHQKCFDFMTFGFWNICKDFMGWASVIWKPKTWNALRRALSWIFDFQVEEI